MAEHANVYPLRRESQREPRQPQQPQQVQEQSHLLLRVSEARSQELERQIGALNQGLRECQEEVTFFRKARDGKQ